jgi:hypothetical protein
MITPPCTVATPAATDVVASPKAHPQRFHGIVPPLVTPLVTADVLDIAGLERLVDPVADRVAIEDAVLRSTAVRGLIAGRRARDASAHEDRVGFPIQARRTSEGIRA